MGIEGTYEIQEGTISRLNVLTDAFSPLEIVSGTILIKRVADKVYQITIKSVEKLPNGSHVFHSNGLATYVEDDDVLEVFAKIVTSPTSAIPHANGTIKFKGHDKLTLINTVIGNDFVNIARIKAKKKDEDD